MPRQAAGENVCNKLL